jgi:hypothetical protein
MAVKKTFEEAIQQLIDVNDMVLKDEISVEKARTIAQNMQVVINAAKLQLDYMKITKRKNSDFFLMSDVATPEEIKKSIAEIKEREKEPYSFSKDSSKEENDETPF